MFAIFAWAFAQTSSQGAEESLLRLQRKHAAGLADRAGGRASAPVNGSSPRKTKCRLNAEGVFFSSSACLIERA
jgi:hypothetical protein